jgi:hypothetical protein
MENLRQAIEQMTKEEHIKFIIILTEKLNLPISVVHDILSDIS